MSGLTVAGLHAGYGSSQVLFDVSLDVRPGTISLVTGPNGTGKTTLLKAILGTITAARGRVLLDGTDLTELSTGERIRAGIGWVPEGRALFPGMTIRDNLRVAGRAWGLRGAELTNRVEEIGRRFPLVGERFDHVASTLSGGQQQSVAIARAFLASPRLLVLDEPSTGLAPIAWRSMVSTCRAVADRGTAVLIVEQRLLDAAEAADQIVVMAKGRVVRRGTPHELLGDERRLRDEYFSRKERP